MRQRLKDWAEDKWDDFIDWLKEWKECLGCLSFIVAIIALIVAGAILSDLIWPTAPIGERCTQRAVELELPCKEDTIWRTWGDYECNCLSSDEPVRTISFVLEGY